MSNEIINVYQPNQRARTGFFQLYALMFKNIIASKELIAQLFKRDFLMAYKKSFLGMTWIFLSPLIGIISWVFMNATGILSPGDVGIPYPAFVLLSSSVWGLFMGFYSSAAQTINAGGGFITQVKYPHEALLVKQTAEHLANFTLGFAMNIVILLIFGVIPSWKIIFFPLLALPLFLLGAGIGLVISVITVVAIDLTKAFDFVFGLLFYITPVIYSSTIDNQLLQTMTRYNPLTYLIGNTRDLIIYGTFDNPLFYFYSVIFAIVIFAISWRLFYLSEEKVIEKLI